MARKTLLLCLGLALLLAACSGLPDTADGGDDDAKDKANIELTVTTPESTVTYSEGAAGTIVYFTEKNEFHYKVYGRHFDTERVFFGFTTAGPALPPEGVNLFVRDGVFLSIGLGVHQAVHRYKAHQARGLLQLDIGTDLIHGMVDLEFTTEGGLPISVKGTFALDADYHTFP